MLKEIQTHEMEVGDLVYFQNPNDPIKGPFLVLGWSEGQFISRDKITFVKTKPPSPTQVVIYGLGGEFDYVVRGYGFFTYKEITPTKFFKSDEIFLQEKV